MAWITKRVIAIKNVHRAFGYILLLTSQAAIVLDGSAFKSFNQQTKCLNLALVLTCVNVGVIVLAIIGCEINLRRLKKTDTPFEAPSNSITREEFEERVAEGEKLVILDNLVIDGADFMGEHPGGKFLLEHCIGKDVSKYFHGGYVLEHSSGITPVTHSNVARIIANGLAVATFNDQYRINQSTSAFALMPREKDCLYYLPASTDYEAFGKHFLISSLSNLRVRRHYTLCQSLREDTYNKYLQAIVGFV